MHRIAIATLIALALAGAALAQAQGSAEDKALWCKAINEELYGIGALEGDEAERAEARQRALEAKADAALASLGLGEADADAVRESYAAEAEMQAADFAAGGGAASLRLDYAACF